MMSLSDDKQADIIDAFNTTFGSYSQIIHFARASSHVAEFNTCNTLLTQKLLNMAFGIINFAKHFLNFINDTMI